LRDEAVSILVGRTDRAMALLTALESGKIRRNELGTTQVKFLRTHRDAKVKAKAAAVFGAAPAPSERQQVVDAFMSAVSLKSDAMHGKAVYDERCASCHKLEGQGFELGPDLITVKSAGKEKMLLGILDPNQEVAPQYQAYEIETREGDTYIGLVSNETATSVTIKQAYGKEDTILRSNILKMRSQNSSLMPEGLESGLQVQDIADLLEYISVAKAGK
jgi:putative heme-binding domain-containing protein